jgi:hypothetical protein
MLVQQARRGTILTSRRRTATVTGTTPDEANTDAGVVGGTQCAVGGRPRPTNRRVVDTALAARTHQSPARRRPIQGPRGTGTGKQIEIVVLRHQRGTVGEAHEIQTKSGSVRSPVTGCGIAAVTTAVVTVAAVARWERVPGPAAGTP